MVTSDFFFLHPATDATTRRLASRRRSFMGAKVRRSLATRVVYTGVNSATLGQLALELGDSSKRGVLGDPLGFFCRRPQRAAFGVIREPE